MSDIVIIGNGVAGITCARHIRKNSDESISVISSETEHFFSRTALMYIFMGHMKYEDTKPYEDWFWKKNRIDLIYDHVVEVDTDNKTVILKSGSKIQFKKLVIASGSVSNMFEYPGLNLTGVQGMYSYPDVQQMEENSKVVQRAVIVGGGLIGIEMAEMFSSRKIPVSFLVRDVSFWNSVLPDNESEIINNHIREHHIDLRLEEELEEILGDGDGRVSGVRTKSGEIIDCQFVGLTIGVRPNISFLKNSKIETDKGVLVNRKFETNIPGIYAIGDCAQFREPLEGRKPVEQVWYTARIQGETLGLILTGKNIEYNPGPWFNSAKFFDIEYQTYGMVSAKPKDFEEHFYWENKCGKIAFRMVSSKETGELIAINTLGYRIRHELCDKLIQQKAKADEAISRMNELNFDPEFYDKHHESILSAYNHKYGKSISFNKKKKSGLLSFFNL